MSSRGIWVRRGVVCAAFLTFMPKGAPAQTITRVSTPRAATDPSLPGSWGFTFANGTMFFSARSGVDGTQLWKSDGTAAGTVRVAKLCDAEVAPQSSTFLEMAEVGGTLFFLATDCTIASRYGLWRSDGTEAGTTLLKSFDGEEPPYGLVSANGWLIFVASDPTYGVELWRSDGTTAGTVMVQDIWTGPEGSWPGFVMVVGGTVYFEACDDTGGYELWKSDGTSGGTARVKDICPGACSSSPQTLKAVGGTLYFSASDGVTGRELWKSDGTEAGTTLVADIAPGAASSTPGYAAVLGETLFFRANDGATGMEPWTSDGTAAGTYRIADIAPGAASSSFVSPAVMGETVFFAATDAAGDRELWRSDGTAAGTARVRDIIAGPGSSTPVYLTVATTAGGEALFFTARSTETGGRELWKSDGTATGTVMVKEILPGEGSAEPGSLKAWPGVGLIFNANDGVHDTELWRSDGTAAGTVMVKDIDTTAASLLSDGDDWNAVPAVVSNGRLLFAGLDGRHGSELWISDGTATGTKLLKDIAPEGAFSLPQAFTDVNGTVFFFALDGGQVGQHGQELWKTDGTTAGTAMVADIRPGTSTSGGKYLTRVGDAVFFQANNGVNGSELWRSDGTPAGTTMVKDIRPGSSGSYPSGLLEVNGTLFFAASDGTNGNELWKSDGTEGGTVMVEDINPGGGSSNPWPLGSAGGALVFKANNTELWTSDGTESGTWMVWDFYPGQISLLPGQVVSLGDSLLFVAGDEMYGMELWRSDGTSVGTNIVADLEPGAAGSSPTNLRVVGNQVFFQATTSADGVELWRTDGYAVEMVKDIRPGGDSSFPGYSAVAGNSYLWFGAWDETAGVELWRTDGTEAGTALVADIQPGSNTGTFPQGDHSFPSLYGPVTGNRLFFSAATHAGGRQLYVADLRAALTVVTSGSGSGTVTSSPAGISCGTDCSEVYPIGTWVTLTATPGGGSMLAAWGGACSGSGACTVRIDQATSVTATFEPGRTLSVTLSGTGAGAVTSSPAGIDCGDDCQEGFALGTLVTLTATPRSDSTFTGWYGACSGTGLCQVTMTADVSVWAMFDRTLSSGERGALVALYNSTNGPAWTNRTNWLGPPGTECTWYGVECVGGSVNLYLFSNNLVGTIPPELENLTQLQTLNLGHNQLTGSIPDSLGNLAQLQYLYLYSNQLSGSIPASLGNLARLQNLSLGGNQLSGSIPASLGNLAQLLVLGLSSNQLSGSIPASLGNLAQLQDLSLGGNQLSGSIPESLGNLAQLLVLGLGSNQLSGSIPESLGNLTQLQSLGMSVNHLSGSIPESLGNLAQLQTLYLYSNQLSGSIPASLGNLARLRTLNLNGNQLSGNIPSALGNLAQLQTLYLYSNQLSGSIPASLGNLAQLQVLYLYLNQLSGSIPASLGNLAQLQYLSLSSNRLSGSIPESLGNLAQLRDLSLSSNQLSGSIPARLGNLVQLQYLYLDSNQLSGSIPVALGNLAQLLYLVLSWNHLSGSIPASLGDLAELQYLYLGGNQLSGNIPAALGNLAQLQILFLSDSQLSGSIPASLGNLAQLQYLSLSSNQLSGSIPASLGNLTNLVAGQTDLRWNALDSTDPALIAFLDGKQMGGDWRSTQTIAPANVAVDSTTAASVVLSWTPILYTSDTGAYRVYSSTSPSGPFALAGTTPDKWAPSWTVTGLKPATTYYFVLETVTEPHVFNANRVVSGRTAPVTATTPPGLEFSAAAYSAAEAGPPATITVMRTGGLGSTFTVFYFTIEGSATEGSDYTRAKGILTFGPGVASLTFTVPIVNDTVVDPGESLTLELSNPTGGAGLGAQPTAVLTIVDNDLGGVVQLGATAYSGTEGGPPITVTVTRTGGAASDVRVDYATGNGTAVAGSDYTSTVGTLTFGAGETSKTVGVAILDDVVGENDETVNLSLGNVQGGATLGPKSTAVLTIHDNEPVVQFSAANYAVSEAGPNAVIQVKRTGLLTPAVTVSYKTADGTAASPADYGSRTGTLTFAPGVASQTFSVPIVNDTLAEGDETVTLFLTGTSGGAFGPQRSAVLTITDNDKGGTVQFSAAAYTVKETAGTATITVTRAGGVASGARVDYTTHDGTAMAGSDYTATSGTLTFAAGQLTQTFTVTIQNDPVGEGPETVALELLNPQGGATLGARRTVTLTIADNDAYVAFGAAAYSITEGATASITIQRANAIAAGMTVTYMTSDGSATAPADYAGRTGTLTFPANASSLTFSVPTANDTSWEGDETVHLMLLGATGMDLGLPNAALLTIKDNDPGGVVQLSAAKYTVAENRPWASVAVTRSGGTGGGAKVQYATSDGTAAVGIDFTVVLDTLTFGPGELTKTLTVPIIDDTRAEGNETVNVALSNPSGGATLGARTAAVIEIVDDEAYFTFDAPMYNVVEGVAVTLTVKRVNSTTAGVTVNYLTGNGTAATPGDYVAAGGTLTFAAGVLSRTITVATVNDTVNEPVENFWVTLDGGPLPVLNRVAPVNIRDNDTGGVVDLSAAAYSVSEALSKVTITVKRSGDVQAAATVAYATADQSAIAGSDYDTTSGTLTFAPRQVAKTITVPIRPDALWEPAETFLVALSNPQPGPGTVLGTQSSAVVTITNDDVSGTIQLAAAQFSASEGSGQATITVTRTGGTASGATVHYQTADATATQPADYTATGGTLAFAAGETSASFTIPIVNDAIPEGGETVLVTLDSPGGGAALGARTAATLWIVE